MKNLYIFWLLCLIGHAAQAQNYIWARQLGGTAIDQGSLTIAISPDYQPLVDLYNSTNGADWIDNTGWLSGDDPCTGNGGSPWFGVSCANGRVTQLDLSGNGLLGPLPDNLWQLTALRLLTLPGNYISGSLPTSVSALTNLVNLNLNTNSLTGTIPDLSPLVNLQVLDISGGNQLSGSIPASLGSLPALQQLILSNNQLNGPIPSSLGNLSALTYLSLNGNQLTDRIPASLSALTGLTYLDLNSNQLSETIPGRLGNLTSLTYLDLNSNQLSGQIPGQLGNLTNLVYFDLSNNQLTDMIPPNLGSLSNLQQLLFNDNQLSGIIPFNLGSLESLQQLYLYNNQLTGSIPSSLGSLTALTDMSLSNNLLTGTIPTSLSGLANLTLLDLSNNQLSGSIPASLRFLNNLSILTLSNNALTGPIPPGLGNPDNLAYLRLNNNQLSGSIPANLANLISLLQLYLQDNQLTGCFPSSFSALCALEIDVNVSTNPGLPGGGDFAAFCATGAGSDAFVGQVTASPTTVSVGGVVSLSATGGLNYTWLAPAGATLSSPATGSVVSATLTASGIQTFTVLVGNGGSCTATSTVSVTVNTAPVSGPFAITAVTTVSCTPILANRFSVSFTPRYDGISGQPISFSVVNELLPTSEPRPYTLQFYTDNPAITLKATQTGTPTEAVFAYNWLEACRTSEATNTRPRLVSPIASQTATAGAYFTFVTPDGTFTDSETPLSLRLSATGVPPGLGFAGATLSGVPSTTVGSPFSVTITATDPGNVAVSTQFLLTVLPATTTPPPTQPFAITGVTTISCTPVADRININLAPNYVGLNGQAIAFEIVNELALTTDPGPYSLTLYRDNPVLILKATQTGSADQTRFSYNWLVACASVGQDNTAPRVNSPIANQTATVGVGYSLNLTNTFADQETPNGLTLTATGLPPGLTQTGTLISGTPSTTGVSTVTVTATDPGSLSVSTSFTLTVNPATVVNPSVFSITDVQTVSCEVLSAGQRRVSFSPIYNGVTGSPISFQVVNELAPTTSPGPYSLNLYTDNPTITLKATQSGTAGEASFAYNWLAACNSNGRVGVSEEATRLAVTVLGNPVEGSSATIEIRGVMGQAVQIELVDAQGNLYHQQALGQAEEMDRVSLPVGDRHGVLLVRVSTATQRLTVKLIRL